MIEFSDFQKVDMHVGKVVEVKTNKKAHKPAYVLRIDFGPLGVMKSSAQLTENYEPQDLDGRQVVGVVNFPSKQIADVQSKVLILGALSKKGRVVLLNVDQPVENGSKIG